MHNITTFPCSLWCMDACSVYNVMTRKCRVVLTLSVASLQRPTQNNHSYLCFVLYFLLPVKHNLQIVMLHPSNGICRQCWEGRDVGPRSFESAVGWGEGRWWDQRNVWESFRPSHWQSRRTGGSGVSARCRRTPYCHLGMEGKESVIEM